MLNGYQNMVVQSDIKPEKQNRERKPPKKITPTYLHNAGMAYLERFPASSGHFRSILMRKVDKSCRHHKEQDRDACAAMVDDLITKFLSMGLLNDDAYVKGMVTSYRRRGLSGNAIKAKLGAKRLSSDVIDQALNNHTDEGGGDDLEAAVLLTRRKKLGPFRSPSKEANRDKELATLARTGFSYDTASKALSMDLDEAEDIIRSIL
jgi:regulatory protein